VTLGAFLVLVVVCSAIYLVHKKMTRSTPGLILAGNMVKAESLVANLDSSDPDLVMTSLSILSDRADSSGKDKAVALLSSKNNYIWFNAALYLGSIEQAEAIPYLIKGLKHPASRSHDKVMSLLQTLTRETFGKDQDKWIGWWKHEHPDSTFTFSYADLEQEAAGLNERSQILINGVVDPLRISHVGPQVRLIGIKLKETASPQDAMNLIENLLAFQFVQLEFDEGPMLDERGARRAFVYWTMSSAAGKMGRKGLSPVPFNEKTLVNAYLLKSGLYEIDMDSVHSETMKGLLRQAAEENGTKRLDVPNSK
jgi:hypothetical protein